MYASSRLDGCPASMSVDAELQGRGVCNVTRIAARARMHCRIVQPQYGSIGNTSRLLPPHLRIVTCDLRSGSLMFAVIDALTNISFASGERLHRERRGYGDWSTAKSSFARKQRNFRVERFGWVVSFA